MQSRHWFMTAAACGAVSLAACSGGSTTIDRTDSGASTEPSADANAPGVLVDFSTYDAGNVAINDAGATTSTCLRCANAMCPSQAEACGKDATCSKALTSFLTCAGTGGGTACFTQETGLLSSGLTASSPIALISICTFQQCAGPADCAIDTSKLTAGIGGGLPGAADAAAGD